MRLLVDTHALLWWLFDSPDLSARARGLIMDRHNDVFVSSACAWEIATKYRLGKLPSARELLRDFNGYVKQAGFTELPITAAHAVRAGTLPGAHRDPFDRMLAAQSLTEGTAVVTRDSAIGELGATTEW